MRKIFLTCPYGHTNKAVVERRFDISNAVAAQIARSGALVFSHVSMSHPINQHLPDLDKIEIGKLWAPLDRVFMKAMDELIIIDESGWKESVGIAREIEFFKSKNRRVSLWSNVKSEFSA